MRLLAAALAACLLGACTTGVTPHNARRASPSPAQTSTPTAAPSPSAGTATTAPHLFVIVMENRSYAQAMADPYIGELARTYAVAANYHGVSHPSLPNYLALTSGTTWGIADDGFHSLPAGGLGSELTAAGVTWRAYMEGMTRTCFNSPYPYALKHDPFAYYGSTCPAQVVPFTRFATDMTGDVPSFVWISPGLCHDGHDCSDSVADAWLQGTVSTIVATSAFQSGGVLFITWDEGEDSANTVATLVIHPNPVVHESRVAYNHYSLLATIEQALGVRRLGAAAGAATMTDLLAVTP